MHLLSFSGSFVEKGTAVSIGNFDGVHLGHQAMLNKLVSYSKQHGLTPTVVLFDPQPLEYFMKDKAPPRLMRLRQKIEQIVGLGVEKILCVAFNESIANLSPKQFIEDILLNQLKANYLLVGQDFRYGHKRAGDVALLQSYSSNNDLVVEVLDTLTHRDKKIGSSMIRQLIQNAQFKEATKLLGNDYQISGKVCHGDKRGRLIKVPTANIALPRLPLPFTGVYKVQVAFLNDINCLDGVANIGFRPTVDGIKPLLEVHIFNFNKEIYGQRMTVKFIAKIRDEKKFDSFEALTHQIQQDIALAKESI